MNLPQKTLESMALQDAGSPFSKHRFIAMVSGAVVVALILTGISLSLYATSGTAQLDLSRPAYSGVRAQAARNDKIESFSNIGPINDDSLQQFRKLYQAQLKDMTAVDAFGGDALDYSSLKID